jgi:hypothetical protein
MMAEIQHFIDNPRIQQRRWVERGRTWLPLLQQARAYLVRLAGPPPAAPAPPAPVGLEIRPRDGAGWGYRWGDRPLEGTFPDFAQALEAALRNRPAGRLVLTGHGAG